MYLMEVPPGPGQKSRGPVRVQTTHFYLNFPVMVIFLQSLWGTLEQVTTINISINFWLELRFITSHSWLDMLSLSLDPIDDLTWKIYEKAPKTLLVPKAKGLDPHYQVSKVLPPKHGLLDFFYNFDMAYWEKYCFLTSQEFACWPVGCHSRGYFQ